MAEQYPESEQDSTVGATRLKNWVDLLLYMGKQGLEVMELDDRTVERDRAADGMLQIAASDRGAVRSLIEDGHAVALVDAARYGRTNIFERLAVKSDGTIYEPGYQLAIELSDAYLQRRFTAQSNDAERVEFLSEWSRRIQFARRAENVEIDVDGMPRDIGDIARFILEARKELKITPIKDGRLPEARIVNRGDRSHVSSLSPVAKLISLQAKREQRQRDLDQGAGAPDGENHASDERRSDNETSGGAGSNDSESTGSKSKRSTGIESPARILDFGRRK